MSPLNQAQLQTIAKVLDVPPTCFPAEIVKMITEEVYKDSPKKLLHMIRSIPPRTHFTAWAGAARESYYREVVIEEVDGSGKCLQRAARSTELAPFPWSKVRTLSIVYVNLSFFLGSPGGFKLKHLNSQRVEFDDKDQTVMRGIHRNVCKIIAACTILKTLDIHLRSYHRTIDREMGLFPTSLCSNLQEVAVHCDNVWSRAHAFLKLHSEQLTTVSLMDEHYGDPTPHLPTITFPRLMNWSRDTSGMGLIQSAEQITSISSDEIDAHHGDESRGMGLLLFHISRLGLATLTHLHVQLHVRFDHDEEEDIHLLAAVVKSCPSLITLDMASSSFIFQPMINAWTMDNHAEGDMIHVAKVLKGLRNIVAFGYHYAHATIFEDPNMTAEDVRKEENWVTMLYEGCPLLRSCKFSKSHNFLSKAHSLVLTA